MNTAHTDKTTRWTVNVALGRAATVFSIIDGNTGQQHGTKTYRFDLPYEGLQDGWAVAGIIQQMSDLIDAAERDAGDLQAASPQDIAINITEEPSRSDSEASQENEQTSAGVQHLITALQQKGYDVDSQAQPDPTEDTPRTTQPTHTTQAEHTPPQSTPQRSRIERPTRRHHPKKHRMRPQGRGKTRIQTTTIAAAATLVVALSAFFILTSNGSSQEHAQSRTQPTSRAAAPTQRTPSTTTLTSAPATSSSQAQQPATIRELHGLSFHTPHGYEAQELPDGRLQLSGQHPELRIYLARDDLHGTDADLILEQMRQEITQSPGTELATDSAFGAEARDTGLFYTEDPGDGSMTYWAAWIEQGQLISVGCHAQHSLGISHRALCRAVEHTVKLSG
ncbi:type VII secretion-associated protein [Corynebacterium argentoratense]|uniref:type VII secretion-associated protein n=1 Tax=Corynebacterium argentoratense TaxID=42817 RepID=UPI0040423A75